jgi:GMP reductase
MKISDDLKLDFEDVLLVPQRSITASRKDVDINKKYYFYHSPREWNGIPIMAANMDTTGSFAMATEMAKMGHVCCLHKHYKTKDLIEFFSSTTTRDLQYVWYSMGMKSSEFIELKKFYTETNIQPNLCIDVANGYSEGFVDYCRMIRKDFKQSIIMAGNVATPEMVQELILHGGVDIVKVGIGPGSACTTRLKTGVGYPQLSAIDECAHAAHGLKSQDKHHGLVCGDGGCRLPADVVKGFAVGADFMMLGGMLAGAYECEGEWQYDEYDAKVSLLFYGMSSKKAQNKYCSGLQDYRSSEGRVMEVPYKGPVREILKDIEGGLRSGCTYTGATSLKDLPKTAKFIRVNRTHHDRSVE